MGRCPCFGFWKGRKKQKGNESAKSKLSARAPPYGLNLVRGKAPVSIDKARTFTYRELAIATGDFGEESFIGQGGFGPVYKGHLNGTGQDVAVKKLNKGGHQGDKEFLVEVLMLSLLHHSNLVNLIGYCAEGDQRLLVYEYMPLGSLENHLHGLTPDMEPLDWNTRMAIAAGAAKGLDYLHNEANPPVILRDLKSSNILLNKGFQPKLSDFGLAKFGPAGEKSHVSTRVMGTYGYCAPEYALSGKLTMKSDIYSFGVVLLELITGRRAIFLDQGHARYLVQWARPMMKDRRSFVQLADPGLKGRFPESVLKNAVEVTSMCLREEPSSRPSVREVSVALDHLMSQKYDPRRVHGPQLRRPVALHPVEPQPQEGSLAGTMALLNKDLERVKTA